MAGAFDPYRALGVRRDATDADVKAAHRRLAKRFHPDADGGDRDRFLRVQEAYKVLSDPLLRREWDARHAPGPIRADGPSPPPARARRPAAPKREKPPASAEGRTTRGGPPPPQEPASQRPRSSRAYTWSAAEVPWWEEGTSENRRQPGRRRPAQGTPRPPRPAGPPQPHAAAADTPNAFDVYNRSSGAAWSMAARAYFRRGDQELPRRGTWQYEGTQVLTGARARTHAEAEARRRAAQPPRREPAAAAASGAAAPGATSGATAANPGSFTYTAAGVSRDARRIHEAREKMRRRLSAATWPTLRERMLYALLAWIPAALVIGYGGAAATGCDVGRAGCPSYLETVQAVGIALVLGLLVALPKVAYIGAMSAIGALFVGLGIVGLMAVVGVRLPLPPELIALLAGALTLAYVLTAVVLLVRKSTTRPWFTGTRAGARP